jgi:hypothetical protein
MCCKPRLFVFGEFKQEQESLISEGALRKLKAKIGMKGMKQLVS